jgi:hypothetical protein
MSRDVVGLFLGQRVVVASIIRPVATCLLRSKAGVISRSQIAIPPWITLTS